MGATVRGVRSANAVCVYGGGFARSPLAAGVGGGRSVRVNETVVLRCGLACLSSKDRSCFRRSERLKTTDIFTKKAIDDYT